MKYFLEKNQTEIDDLISRLQKIRDYFFVFTVLYFSVHIVAHFILNS
jgi:hypothetical protein